MVDQINEPVNPRVCQHKNWKPRRRTIGGGQVRPEFQCLDCTFTRALKRADYPNLDELEPFDDGHAERIYAVQDRVYQLEREQRAAKRESDRLDWTERYYAYLETPAWRERRAKVLRRAGGVCEACADRPAVEVHHTTYEHVGCEPLFDLRAVCRECHEQITRLDRGEIEGLAAQ